MFRPSLVALAISGLLCYLSVNVRADDDEGNPSIPPVDPGDGYGDIYPNPTLPPNYEPHTNTSPNGVGQIANTQSESIRLGQTFQAAASSLDWVAMVFQYNYQPNTGPMDPALFRIHVASGIVTSGDNSGDLINVLGSTGVESITPDPLTGDSLGWILFDFPSTVSLTPGNQYYLRVEHTGGYGVDNTGVGVATGRLGSNFYSSGRTWRAIYNQFLDRWEQFAFRNEDLIFSLGSTIQDLPGDFDADGDLDGRDFLLWQRGQSPIPLSAGDLADWQGNFGAGAISSVSVPEPNCLALLFGLVFLKRHRK